MRAGYPRLILYFNRHIIATFHEIDKLE